MNNHLRVVLKKAVDSGDIEQASELYMHFVFTTFLRPVNNAFTLKTHPFQTRGHGATGSFRMGKEQEKMLQVGIPIKTQPMMMLKEVRQKMETVSVSKVSIQGTLAN